MSEPDPEIAIISWLAIADDVMSRTPSAPWVASSTDKWGIQTATVEALGESGMPLMECSDEFIAVFAAASRNWMPLVISALRVVLSQHQPRSDVSGSSWRHCSCGAKETRLDGNGGIVVAPAEYPCATLKAVSAALSPDPWNEY